MFHFPRLTDEGQLTIHRKNIDEFRVGVKERRESSQDERGERAQERERRHRYWSISDGEHRTRRVPICRCLYVFFALGFFSSSVNCTSFPLFSCNLSSVFIAFVCSCSCVSALYLSSNPRLQYRLINVVL